MNLPPKKIERAGTIEAPLKALSETVSAQQAALSELAGSAEQQADTVAGIVLVLRALIDVVTDEEQRAMIEKHLVATLARDESASRRSIVDALLV